MYRYQSQPPRSKQERAALFSVTLNFFNSAYTTNFSPLHLRRGMNGIGTSGIAVSELSFSVPRTAYAESTVSDMAPAVTFAVTGSGVTVTAPTFYVDSRTPSGGVINFVCYDRLAFADGITLTEADVGITHHTDSKTGKDKINDTAINAQGMLTLCAQKLGLTIGSGTGIFSSITKTKDASAMVGQTVSQILSELSTAGVGVFYIANDNTLCFAPCGTATSVIGVSPISHAATDKGAQIQYTGLYMSDSSGNTYTSGTDTGRTISISTEYADQVLCTAVAAPLLSHTFMAISCAKSILPCIPEVGNNISYGDAQGTYILSSADMTITSYGIYASLTSCADSGGEIAQYMSRERRMAAAQLTAGQKYKNIVINRYGQRRIEE